MTTTELYPSGSATAAMIRTLEDAAATLTEVREAPQPVSEEGRAAVEWACGELEEALAVCARLKAREMDPFDVLAPDMGWWDDPQAQAEEYAADQARQIAIAARKRLAEYKGREYAALVRAREWMSL